MASGTLQAPYFVIEDLTSQVVTKATLSTNEIRLFRYGKMGFFMFRMKGSFPYSWTNTHQLPIHPPETYSTIVSKSNANGGVAVQLESDGKFSVVPYITAYNDWISGQLWFPIED